MCAMESKSDEEETIFKNGVSADCETLTIKEEIIDVQWMVNIDETEAESDSTPDPLKPDCRSECGSPFKNNMEGTTKPMVELIYQELLNLNEEDDDDNLSDSSASTEENAGFTFEGFQNEFSASVSNLNDDYQHEPVVKRGKLTTEWSDTPLLNCINQNPPPWEAVPHLPKVVCDKSSLSSEVSCFSLLFDDVVVDHLVACANEEITQKTVLQNSKPRPTNSLELRASLGLLFLKGVMRNSNLSFYDLFSELYGPPLLRATMSKSRMEFLLCALRFDAYITSVERNVEDKFNPVREFWNLFCNNCAKCYSPSEYLTIGNSVFGSEQKWPSKITRSENNKSTLRVISICDAQTFYFCGGVPYFGGNRQLKKYLLECLKRMSWSNRNVTLGNRLSSCALAEELSQLGLTMVGVLRKTEKNVPPRFISSKKQPLQASQFAYQQKKMMVSFNDNRGNNLILLSTMRNSGAVNPITGKPDLLEFYEKTVQGVKVIDEQCKSLSAAMPSNRWLETIFIRALDLAGINSFILFNLTTDTFCGRVDFLKRLAFSLAEPLMKQTLYNTNVPKIVRQNVCQVLGLEPRKHIVEVSLNGSMQSVLSGSANSRRRCWFCDTKKDRKTSKYCGCCYLPICGEHSVSVTHCQLCARYPEKPN